MQPSHHPHPHPAANMHPGYPVHDGQADAGPSTGAPYPQAHGNAPGAVMHAYPAALNAQAPAGGTGGWLDFSHPGYLKGLLLGAGVTLLVTSPSVQKFLIRGAVKAWSMIQGGMEEVKEQFRDVKAEMSQDD